MENIDWGHLLLQFDGRINRAKFWLGIVVIWLAEAITFVVLGGILGYRSPIVFLIWLFFIWPALAIAIKRWHDRDKSGWWILIGLIPIIGPIWVLIETGLLPGTDGPNQYGPDPLAAGIA